MTTMDRARVSRVCCAVVLGLLVFVSASSAQESKSFATKGTYELGGNVSYQYTSFLASGTETSYMNFLSVLPYAGYFVSDNIEIGVNPLGIQRSWRSSGSTTSYTMFIAPAYNFKAQGNVYLFAEAQLGYTGERSSSSFGSPFDMDGFSWGGRVGVKIPAGVSGLLNLGVQYQQITLKSSGFTGDVGQNILMVFAGFSVWL